MNNNEMSSYSMDEQRSLVPLEIGTAPMGGTEEYFHDEVMDENGMRIIASNNMAPHQNDHFHLRRRPPTSRCRTCCYLFCCLVTLALIGVGALFGLIQAGVVETPYSSRQADASSSDGSSSASHLTPRNREDLDYVLQKYHHSLLMYYWPPSESIRDMFFGKTTAAHDVASWNEVAEALEDTTNVLVGRIDCRESSHTEMLCSELWTTLREHSDPIVALYEEGKRLDFFDVPTNHMNSTSLITWAKGYIDSAT